MKIVKNFQLNFEFTTIEISLKIMLSMEHIDKRVENPQIINNKPQYSVPFLFSSFDDLLYDRLFNIYICLGLLSIKDYHSIDLRFKKKRK